MKRCEEKIRYGTAAGAKWALWGIWLNRFLRGPSDELAALDERYIATQYRRTTALALVLGSYIRAHLDDFVAR